MVSKPFVSCNSLLNSLLERRAERSLSILRPTTICSMGLQQILGQFDPQHQGMVVVEALCLPPICKNHPVQSLSLASGKGTPPGPTSLSSRPIWIESAIADGPSIVGALTRSVRVPLHGSTMERERPLGRFKRDRASTDEWSPTKASGSALTYSEAGLFLDDTVPDMSDQWCPAYFKRFKVQIGNMLKETCSLPDGDGHDVEP